jgi:homogentisate 1,2-dioxygenase
MIAEVGESKVIAPVAAVSKNISPRMIQGFQAEPTDDFLDSRTPVLFNDDVTLAVAAPTGQAMAYYYKNGDSDELIFVHKGTGTMVSLFGELAFGPKDYIHIPRGTIYQMTFDSEDNRLFIIESKSAIKFPKRYTNGVGQLLEHSPFCERDLRLPEFAEAKDEVGRFTIKVKKAGMMHHVVYGSHPFDVVGWDGYCFPYAFNALDFEPITGRVHQPPIVHQNFEAHNFVVCTFAPRMYDYHPKAIPSPYNHSNIDSDEVLYYVDGDFMSRNHVEQGFISLHPAGIPHGPHPGAYERSIGQTATEELAVMVDTFRPLQLTQAAIDMGMNDYWASWQES